jgi:hypothetical protein
MLEEVSKDLLFCFYQISNAVSQPMASFLLLRFVVNVQKFGKTHQWKSILYLYGKNTMVGWQTRGLWCGRRWVGCRPTSWIVWKLQRSSFSTSGHFQLWSSSTTTRWRQRPPRYKINK